MAIAIASKSTAQATNNDGVLTVTKPTGLAAGDLLVAFISTGSGGGALTGWTAIGSEALGDTSGFGLHMVVLAKVADAGDAAASDFTFTMTTANRRLVHLFRITGDFSAGVASLIVSDNDNNVTKSGSTFTFPGGVTPLGANSFLLFGAIGGDPTSSASNTFSNFAVTNSNPSWTIEYNSVMPGGAADSILAAVASATFTPASTTGAYLVDNSEAANEVGGKLVAITEVQNGSVTLDLASLTATPRDFASLTGGANVTLDAASMTATAQTVTAAAAAAKWVNTDKSSAGSITNQDKTA